MVARQAFQPSSKPTMPLFKDGRASDIEIMMRERFNVLNHIIWAKPSGRWNGCNKESLRAYFPATERVLFAEHYQGHIAAKVTAMRQKKGNSNST